jgi:membrane protein implicated in regulation of membrane protease activity
MRNFQEFRRLPPKVKWRIAARYALFQLPGGAILCMVLIVLRHWVSLPSGLLWALVAMWVVKDVVLFPFVWRAYDDRSRTTNPLIGAEGIVESRLDPSGYIRMRGELWQVEVETGFPAVEKGRRVRVREVRGLTLHVEPEEEKRNV